MELTQSDFVNGIGREQKNVSLIARTREYLSALLLLGEASLQLALTRVYVAYAYASSF